jgi:hypothetical protein
MPLEVRHGFGMVLLGILIIVDLQDCKALKEYREYRAFKEYREYRAFKVLQEQLDLVFPQVVFLAIL